MYLMIKTAGEDCRQTGAPTTTPGKVYVEATKQLYLNTLHGKRMCGVVPQQI